VRNKSLKHYLLILDGEGGKLIIKYKESLQNTGKYLNMEVFMEKKIGETIRSGLVVTGTISGIKVIAKNLSGKRSNAMVQLKSNDLTHGYLFTLLRQPCCLLA
jgi:hypothetical protein